MNFINQMNFINCWDTDLFFTVEDILGWIWIGVSVGGVWINVPCYYSWLAIPQKGSLIKLSMNDSV